MERARLLSDWYLTPDFLRETTRIRRRDDVLRENSIEKVECWKLDVEGAEYEALLGASLFLKAQAIGHVFFECHPSNDSRCQQLLEGFGYQIYCLKRGPSDAEERS